MLLGLSPWVNLAILIACNILVFVPIKYIYPSRNNRLRRLTLALTYLFAAVGVWGLIQYPNVPEWVVSVSFVYLAYYALLSLFPKIGAVKSA